MISYGCTVGSLEWRPLLEISVDPAGLVAQTCLVDSGALGVRLDALSARNAGLTLPAAPNRPDVIAGGVRSQAFEVRVPLTVELGGHEVTWRAPVIFCDPWPHPFGLLGQRGFFDAFDVRFEGRSRRFECLHRGDSP